MSEKINGIIPALITPFIDGAVSKDKIKINVEKYNEFGLAGYLVLGSTGESILMNNNECITAIKAVKDYASKDKVIIAGTGRQSTFATIAFTNRAADAGADYALVVTPFYYKTAMTAEALQRYYIDVAEGSKIPVLMYSVPKFTALSLPVETISSVMYHTNIAGIKDSSGDITRLNEIIATGKEEFSVLQGSGSVIYDSLDAGADGCILGLANIAPGETVEVFDAFRTGDHSRARNIQERLVPANKEIVGNYGVPGIKFAMELLGYYGGHPRLPILPAGPEMRTHIKTLLETAGLL